MHTAGQPLIRERFAKPVEHRQISPWSPEWKECGNGWGAHQVQILLDVLAKKEAQPSSLPPLPLSRVSP